MMAIAFLIDSDEAFNPKAIGVGGVIGVLVSRISDVQHSPMKQELVQHQLRILRSKLNMQHQKDWLHFWNPLLILL